MRCPLGPCAGALRLLLGSRRLPILRFQLCVGVLVLGRWIHPISGWPFAHERYPISKGRNGTWAVHVRKEEDIARRPQHRCFLIGKLLVSTRHSGPLTCLSRFDTKQQNNVH